MKLLRNVYKVIPKSLLETNRDPGVKSYYIRDSMCSLSIITTTVSTFSLFCCGDSFPAMYQPYQKFLDTAPILIIYYNILL